MSFSFLSRTAFGRSRRRELVAASLVVVAAGVAAVVSTRTALAQNEAVEEVVVTADFRQSSVAAAPESVSVLDAAELRATTVQHFEEAIRLVPNLNLSGEGSRARYFQLRGVGELEQYEGSPNPSIGFIVDDIDFSGLGSVGTLFDVERVEVLRGPQGTRYGANALGGLIYMRSAEPPKDFGANFEMTGGSDDTRAIGAAVGGPISDALKYRASVQQYRSDGFRHNVFLDRDDTYGRDELSAHGKLSWRASDTVDVDFAGLYVDVDNGYDAWAIDNGFDTYSDKPGRDAQRSAAGSIRVEAQLADVDLVSISSVAKTDAVFSFDADWGNAAYWAPYTYDYITSNDRDRRSYNQEIRVLSKPGAIAGGRGSWLFGVYALDLRERNDHLDRGILDDLSFCTPCTLDNPVVSDYDATNRALFGQVEIALREALELTAGLRWERRDADYTDSSGNRFGPSDDMVGGELALVHKIDPRRSVYARLARGYKAGGFNVSLAGVDFTTVDNVVLTPAQIPFGPETLTSVEGGFRVASAGGALRADVSVFYAHRDDEQIKVPLQLRLGDPSSFLLVTANAERGEHYGVETTVEWQATQRFALSAAVGLLRTKIDRFALFPSLEGREQAHAPDYTYSLGAEYRTPSGWRGRLDVSGMAKFFYDFSHDEQSKPYSLVNVRVGRDWGPWGLTLWSRNLLDKKYFVRGFFFGNEPPDFTPTLYTRLGDPRQSGLTVTYEW